MTTWGPSKRQTSKSRQPKPPAPRPARQQPTNEIRDAVDGREHEFIGIGLIVAGALIGLAIYFNLAGPLGRAIETLLGWFVGLARYAIPVGLVAAGVALVSKGRSSSPVRLGIGWGMIAMAVVGIAHIINGPDGVRDFDDMYSSGGLIGAIAAEPLQALLAPAGGFILLLALGIGGALLITRTSVKTMAMRTSAGVGSVARPLGRAARQALRELSSLSSERGDDNGDATVAMGQQRALPPPQLYDAADDFADPPALPRAKRTPKPVRPPSPGRSSVRGRCRRSPTSTAPARTPSTGRRSRRAARRSRTRWPSTAWRPRSSA